MTRYIATIQHHSISRARVVPVGETLTQAKRNATREFGDEFLDYTIQVYDRQGYEDDAPLWIMPAVAIRKVGERKWRQTW